MNVTPFPHYPKYPGTISISPPPFQRFVFNFIQPPESRKEKKGGGASAEKRKKKRRKMKEEEEEEEEKKAGHLRPGPRGFHLLKRK